MKSDIQSTLESIKAPFAELVQKVDSIPAAVEAGEQAAYDQGYQDGKASVVLPVEGTGDKLFTQEDMNKLAETAKQEVRDLEMTPAIESLNAQITELSTRVGNLENELAQAGPNAVANFKAELKAKYAEQQVAETQGETGFQALLD